VLSVAPASAGQAGPGAAAATAMSDNASASR